MKSLVIAALVLIIAIYFLAAWLLMMSFGVLHSYFVRVPSFSFLECLLFAATLKFLFYKTVEAETKTS